jgi:hypothetical protein
MYSTHKTHQARAIPVGLILRRLAVWFCYGVAAVALGILLGGCATLPKDEPQAIAIESVRITAAGHYVDLRYRVIDPVRANELLGPGVKPSLTDEETGAVMRVPMTAKLGALRQTRGDQRTDRSYFVLFANTAGIKSGDSVTADLGGMTFANLIVE